MREGVSEGEAEAVGPWPSSLKSSAKAPALHTAAQSWQSLQSTVGRLLSREKRANKP